MPCPICKLYNTYMYNLIHFINAYEIVYIFIQDATDCSKINNFSDYILNHQYIYNIYIII